MTQTSKIAAALPFWLSILLFPMAWFVATQGGWWLAILPLSTWALFTVLDFVIGLNVANEDAETPDDALFWHRAITWAWAPLQVLTLLGLLAYITQTDHLALWEEYLLFAAFGVISGTVGINYSHELMHQKPKFERWFADILLASVLYSHFRSEHLLVHHRYVGTPRDPVTARYGEGFWRFFARVFVACGKSAFGAEKAMLARKNLRWTHRSNPFWRYWALQLAFLIAAIWIGGLWGLFLFTVQAFSALFQLELVNYIEHYGLTRKHLGDGKYEHTQPHHSWNAAHKASNWLLINLQRHSDHHFKPDRRYPLLQNYTASEAPQLPFGYPLMTMAAMFPRLWRKMMNPRVQAWRALHYPEITDWSAYKDATNPMPR